MERKESKQILNYLLYTIPVIIMFLGCRLELIYFVQSDDFWMNNICWGAFSGIPSEHIVFIKSILGEFLKVLYNINSQPNWFGLFYLFIVILAVYSFLLILKKYVRFPVALCIACFFECMILLWLTFTVIAYICIFVGVIIILEIDKEKSFKTNIVKCFFSCFFIINAYIFRDDAFFTGLLVLIPLYIFGYKKSNKKMVICVAVLSALAVFGINIYEKMSYGSDLWKDYSSYNGLRSANVDYPIDEYEDNKELYDRLGLSKNDVDCLKNWIFSDKVVYSDEVLREIPKKTNLSTRYNISVIGIIKEMAEYPIAIIYLVLFVIILVIIIALSKKNRLIQILQLLFSLGCICALFVINRPVERVVIPLILIGTASVFYMYLREGLPNSFKGILSISITLTIIVAISSICIYANYEKKHKMAQNYEEERDYMRANPDTLFVVERMHPFTQHQPVTKVNKTEAFKNIMDIGHWRIYNDVYYDNVKKFNLAYEDRLYFDLVENDNVLFLYEKFEDIDALEVLTTFLEEHTGRKVKANVVKEFKQTGDMLYKFEYND